VNKNNFQHLGRCTCCLQQKDLNDYLLCKECQKKLDLEKSERNAPEDLDKPNPK
jgi:hypothetical protein